MTTTVPEPIDETILTRMLRFGLRTGADRVEFQPGRRPWVDGMGGPRELRHRQLTGEDTGVVVDYFLGNGLVSSRLRGAASGGASSLPLLVEWKGEALLDARITSVPGGLRVCVDLVRPLPPAQRKALEQEL
ncbi:MAG: hypothetical protein QNK05_01380 [Myxococcota bacterium]|nr:hypothetical protein [Myxococcota bacterium]